MRLLHKQRLFVQIVRPKPIWRFAIEYTSYSLPVRFSLQHIASEKQPNITKVRQANFHWPITRAIICQQSKTNLYVKHKYIYICILYFGRAIKCIISIAHWSGRAHNVFFRLLNHSGFMMRQSVDTNIDMDKHTSLPVASKHSTQELILGTIDWRKHILYSRVNLCISCSEKYMSHRI